MPASDQEISAFVKEYRVGATPVRVSAPGALNPGEAVHDDDEVEEVLASGTWEPVSPVRSAFRSAPSSCDQPLPRLRSAPSVPNDYAPDERIPRQRFEHRRFPTAEVGSPSGDPRHNPLTGPLVSTTLETRIEERRLREVVVGSCAAEASEQNV
jgi:hypothetical protein